MTLFPDMRRGPAIWLFALLLVALAAASPAAAEPCEIRDFEGNRYTVCTFDLRRHALRLFWQDEEGRPYASFRNLPSEVDGAPLVFAMNAGMYDVRLAPIGLYVEGGRELKRINTNDGPGNFHLMPNGVFYVAGDRAGVAATRRFVERRPQADYATQSGPMLVIEGELHPRFLPHSTSRRLRNGVGVRDPHTVVFAISEGLVTFHEFASLFRDGLACDDALYLDGSMSSLHAPGLGRSDSRRPMGPIVAVLEPAR